MKNPDHDRIALLSEILENVEKLEESYRSQRIAFAAPKAVFQAAQKRLTEAERDWSNAHSMYRSAISEEFGIDLGLP